MSKAILYDATLCIGCKQCEGACAQQNRLPYDDKVAAESVQSEHKYTVVLDQERQISCAGCASTASTRPALRYARLVPFIRQGRPGGIRRLEVPRLPVLHGGLRVLAAQVRVGKAEPTRAQVHHVPRPGGGR